MNANTVCIAAIATAGFTKSTSVIPAISCAAFAASIFHDRESQEVSDHIHECGNRNAIARGMKPAFPVRNPIEAIDPRELHKLVAQMFQDNKEKQNKP